MQGKGYDRYSQRCCVQTCKKLGDVHNEEKTGNGKGTYPGNSLYMVNLGYLSALIDLIEEKYREMQWT